MARGNSFHADVFGPKQCNNCGEEWPYDPALLVACPDCRADVGAMCVRPSGHPAAAIHAAREPAALAAGVLKRCGKAALVAQAVAPPQADLFAMR